MVWCGVLLTEHSEELLDVQVLHAPLGLETMCLGVDVVVERRLSAKRINDAQQTTAIIMYISVSN